MGKHSLRYHILRKIWIFGLSIRYSLIAALKNKLMIHASSCTYYFLVSLVPILILTGWGVLSVTKRPEFAAILDNITFYQAILYFVDNMGITIPQPEFTFSIVGLFGILYALWSASALMRGIAGAFSDMFSSQSRKGNIVSTLAAYFFIPLFLMIAIIFVSLTKLFAEGIQWLLSDMLNLLSYTEIGSAIAAVVTYSFVWLAALVAFMLLAPRRPRFKVALFGSLIFAVYFFVLQSVILSMAANLISRYAVYGALGTLLLVLLWAYLVFFGLFATAQLTAIIDSFRQCYHYDSLYLLLKPSLGKLELYLAKRIPFMSNEHLVDMAMGESLKIETEKNVAIVKLCVGMVTFNGIPLAEGEHRYLSQADVSLTAVQDSRVLVVNEEEWTMLRRIYPSIWEEVK